MAFFDYCVFFLVALLRLFVAKRQNDEKMQLEKTKKKPSEIRKDTKPKDKITPKRNLNLKHVKALAKCIWFLVCCTVDNVNVEANMCT